MQAIQDEIKQLTDELNQHNYRYYISGANANELSDSERAAVEQHFQILDQQQEASDNQTLDGFQADLDSQLEQAEEEFMEGACAEHELTFDSDSQVCY